MGIGAFLRQGVADTVRRTDRALVVWRRHLSGSNVGFRYSFDQAAKDRVSTDPRGGGFDDVHGTIWWSLGA